MTACEAREYLEKVELLLKRINRLTKQVDHRDPFPLIQLQRRRIALLPQQIEAENILINSDPAFYSDWVKRNISPSNSYEHRLVVESMNERTRTVNEMSDALDRSEIKGFFVDPPSSLRIIYEAQESENWKTDIANSPLFDEDSKEQLLAIYDHLQEYYTLYDEWEKRIKKRLTHHLAASPLYTDSYFRILWVVPNKQLNSFGERCPDSMLLASFAIQQLYYYLYDDEEIWNYTSLTEVDPFFFKDAQERFMVIRQNEENLHETIASLQPNVILAPSSLPAVQSTLGINPNKNDVALLTGKLNPCGYVTGQIHQGIILIGTPDLNQISEDKLPVFIQDILSFSRFSLTGDTKQLDRSTDRIYSQYAYGSTPYTCKNATLLSENPFEVVTIKVFESAFNEIEEHPLHHSQMLLSDHSSDNRPYKLYQYILPLTLEWVRQIIGWGTQIVVKSPLALKKDIIEQLDRTLKEYTQ